LQETQGVKTFITDNGHMSPWHLCYF